MARRFAGQELLIATHNAGKRAEFEALLAPFGIAVKSNVDFALPEPDETEDNFLGNATIKAQHAMAATGLPALADDSGIVIDALDGAPGVYTADWAETPQGRDFAMAMRRTHELLEERQAPHPRRARFVCMLVLMWPDGHREHFEGRIEGQVVWPMRGVEGHGYDPIFQPDGYGQTLGELPAAEKNRISHRADAVAKLLAACFDS